MKYVLRIIVSPFVLGLFLGIHLTEVFKRLFEFIKYGGEWANYEDRNEKATIKKIYKELKTKHGSTK